MWIFTLRVKVHIKINDSWFCDICIDGLDYGIRGKVNHILSKSEKHDKIMEDFVYEKMGRPKITLISWKN